MADIHDFPQVPSVNTLALAPNHPGSFNAHLHNMRMALDRDPFDLVACQAHLRLLYDVLIMVELRGQSSPED